MFPWSDRRIDPAVFRDDPDLRDELEFCERAGIGHSRFLAWLPDDQDKAVAYLRWKRECCTGCGAHPSEWAYFEGPAGKLVLDEQDPPFETAMSSCLGCQMTADARKQVPSERSMSVRVFLVPRRRDADKAPEELEAEIEAEEANWEAQALVGEVLV